MSVKNYQDLIAWQKATDLVAAAYVLADALPQSETLGLAARPAHQWASTYIGR